MKGIDEVTPEDILSFWFPGDLDEDDRPAMLAFWDSRMQGGMDAAIIAEFGAVTLAAAEGRYDDWAGTPEGRLALILLLDQFPRSLWRDTPGAFGQDIKATRLALDGIANGHYAALGGSYKRTFYKIAIGHCEGPDHLARMDLLVSMSEAEAEAAPGNRREAAERTVAQTRRIREVIRRFGRHPHRNAILGRIPTPEEAAYVAEGDFPHLKRPPPDSAGGGSAI